MRIELTNEKGETLVVDYSAENVHVCNSYAVNKKDIPAWVKLIKKTGEEHGFVYSRKEASWTREWRAHNFLYNMDYQKERTKDVDLDQHQTVLHTIGYFILSLLLL